MKSHTSQFKENIAKFGRELDSKITYTTNGVTTELGTEQLNSVSPHYEGVILKSVMKQLDIDSNVEIPVGTELNYQFGIKVGNSYEYMDYGNYIVKDIEKQEDTYSWKITCYDKLLYTMKDYEIPKITTTDITFSDDKNYYQKNNDIYNLYDGERTGNPTQLGLYEETRYPITVRDYINAICIHCGLTFKNAGEQFANYDKVINNELYLDNEGNSLGYTFRDVLDELAQVTASTICINSEDKVEIRYIQDVGEITNITASSFYLTDSEEVELSSFELEGKSTQASTPTPDNPSDIVSIGFQNLLKNTATNSGDNNYWGIYATFDAETRTLTQSRTQTTEGYIRHYLPGLKSGTTYTLTLYAKSNGYVKGMDLFCFNENTQGVVSLSNIIPTTEFQKYTYTFTTASDVVYGSGSSIRIDHNGSTIQGTEAILTVKDVCLTETNLPCDYIDYGKYGVNLITTGKNLFDTSSIPVIKFNSNNQTIADGIRISVTTAGSYRSLVYKVMDVTNYVGQTFTLKADFQASASNNGQYVLGLCNEDGSVRTPGVYGPTSGVAISYTIPQITTAKYLAIWFYSNNAGTSAVGNYVDYTNIQLEKGNQATTYEPFKESTYLYVLNEPLRAINDIKDKLYIQNGYLYVERNIGKATLVGNDDESWQKNAGATLTNTNYFSSVAIDGKYKLNGSGWANYFTIYSSLWSTDVEGLQFSNDSSRTIRVRVYKTTADSVADFKTWLSTHNVEVYYALKEPIIEELGAVRMPSTYKEITHINTTDTLAPTTNISYISDFEEIDEEYLKDINVNFGEKFGAVNTIVLSRGGDGDKISLSEPENLPDTDKIAIQISDNQIMNGNDRDTYMPDLLHQLYGLEYYINDFTSTGICYLDLCDRYRVKVFGASYKCIMFNDNVEITQGLKEDIYTDMQEENQQEYKYMSSTDRGITQANIIAKKNEATITEYTQKIDEANNRLSAVETKQTETDRTINIMSTNIDANGNITEVTTTTGFTFNADGMTIHKSDADFYAVHDETGTRYYDGGLNDSNIVGQYTKDGSKQKDLALFGVYYYGMDEIDDTPMFVAELYTDENSEECFGHFYNRGD